MLKFCVNTYYRINKAMFLSIFLFIYFIILPKYHRSARHKFNVTIIDAMTAKSARVHGHFLRTYLRENSQCLHSEYTKHCNPIYIIYIKSIMFLTLISHITKLCTFNKFPIVSMKRLGFIFKHYRRYVSTIII